MSEGRDRIAPQIPGGKPIPGRTNEDDVRWALDKARRFIFRGGDSTDPRYKAYVDRWLDYALTLGGRIDRV
jgi:hypothetical protein